MKIGRLLEFIVIGIAMGIVEDVIAVSASTGEPITWNIILIVTLVAIPFGIVSELVVDHFKPFHKKKRK